MNVKITYVRVPIDWDITVSVTAENAETINHVKTIVNGFTEDDQEVNPPASGWQIVLRQKGQYPGQTNVVVTVTDGNGHQTNWHSLW